MATSNTALHNVALEVRARFTEQLYVARAGTDGWSRLSAYDAGAAQSFVLAPE